MAKTGKRDSMIKVGTPGVGASRERVSARERFGFDRRRVGQGRSSTHRAKFHSPSDLHLCYGRGPDSVGGSDC